MARTIKVAALQLTAVRREPETYERDRAAVVERIVRLIEDAGKEGVQIAALPELSLTPFFPNTLIRDNDYLFDDLPAPFIEPILEAATRHGMVLLLPYAEAAGACHYNACLVFDADGSIIGKYRKIHIPCYFPSNLPGGTGSYERMYFAPGDLEFPIFHIPRLHTYIGVQICADRMFPEGYRILTLKGAEIIFNPTCYGTYGRPDRVPAWGRLLQARAYENGIFVVAPNKAGSEGVRENAGRSVIYSPLSGEQIIMGSPDGEEIVAAAIDLDDVAEARKRLPWWLWRRPHEYEELVR